MSRRPWPVRIRDILDAIAEIQQFVAGISYEDFLRNPEKRKAVLADFAIIGEAGRNVPDDVKAAHPEVAWSDMQRMRNIVVHVYFAVEPQIVWDTIQNDLPPLAEQLNAMLSSQD